MKDEILEYLYNNDTGNILIYMNSFMPFCHKNQEIVVPILERIGKDDLAHLKVK